MAAIARWLWLNGIGRLVTELPVGALVTIIPVGQLSQVSRLWDHPTTLIDGAYQVVRQALPSHTVWHWL